MKSDEAIASGSAMYDQALEAAADMLDEWTEAQFILASRDFLNMARNSEPYVALTGHLASIGLTAVCGVLARRQQSEV